MIIAICVALVLITLYLFLRYVKLKNNQTDKQSLAEAYLKRDYDQYLTIVNYKINHTSDIKDKNILLSLKMQAYLCQGQWEKIQALYKQINLKDLPKKVKLTFLCHYITALYLSGDTARAKAFVEKNKKFLAEGDGNISYQIYLDGFKGFQAYEDKAYDKSEAVFNELISLKVGGDFYQEVYQNYLTKIAEARNNNNMESK